MLVTTGVSAVHEGDAIASSWSKATADYECSHGRLAGDECPSPVVTFTSPEFRGRVVQTWPHAYPCGCWPSERLARILPTGKEPKMLNAAPVALPTEPDVSAAIAAAATIKPARTPRRPVTAVVHATTSPLLASIAGELDAEIARLQAARDALEPLLTREG